MATPITPHLRSRVRPWITKLDGLGETLIIRALTLIVAFPCALLSTRLIISTYGPSVFALVTLIASLPALIPFADLGLGTAMLNATTDIQSGHRVTHAARRITAGVVSLVALSAVFVVTSLVIGSGRAWLYILGDAATSLPPSDVNTAATMVGILFGVNVALAGAVRILQGLELNAQVVGMLGCIPLLNLALVWLGTLMNKPPYLIAVANGLAAVSIGIVIFVVAYGRSMRAGLIGACKAAGLPGSSDFISVWKIGTAALVVSAGLAIAFQLDRLVLSHSSSVHELAIYSAVIPLYLAALGIMNPVGQQLWPKFRKLSMSGANYSRIHRNYVMTFAAGGVAAGLLFLGGGPLIVGWTTAGEISPNWPVFAAGGLLLLVQYTQMPSGMLLTDQAGFSFQAKIVTVMATTNIVLTLLLVPPLGANGALLASVLAILVAQLPWTYRRASQVARGHLPQWSSH